VDQGIKGNDAPTLGDQITSLWGIPRNICFDNGSEFPLKVLHCGPIKKSDNFLSAVLNTASAVVAGLTFLTPPCSKLTWHENLV
jgi:hypothetical protein